MLGHVHAGRWDEQRSFAYPGSLEPLDSSEAGPRGAILLDVTTSNLRVEWMPVAQRDVRAEEMDITTISTIAEFRRQIARRQPAWEHALVSLRLVGVLNGELEDTDAIRSAFRDEVVELTIVAEPQEDLTGLARQETTLGLFVRTVGARLAGAGDDESRRYWSRVLRVGARAFRGREVAQT
jgi:DNA repair exonuclease SbcCD nuclease subunit